LAARTWILYGIATAALFVFLWLGHMVMTDQTLAFDTAVRNTVHGWASDPLTLLMTGITQMGAPPVLIAVTLLAGWRFAAKGYPRLAAVLAISTIGAAAAEESVKLIYHRIRPVAFLGYDEPMTYSFPSGHAATSVCFYGLLAIIVAGWTKSAGRRQAVWAAAVLIILLIGFSRIYLGVHYPTDVLGGYAFGLVWILAVVPAAVGRWLRPS
jgi:membrane-associated phospholipid phosphatase